MAIAVFASLIACSTAVFFSIGTSDSDALSRSQANAANNSGTRCAWDCNVVSSTFGLEMKALISKFRLITLQLKYDQQEAKQCLNQTSLQRNSSIAELWIWLTGDKPSHDGQNRSLHFFNKSNNWFQKLLEGQIELGVSCSLKPATDSNDTKPSVNDVIAMMLIEEVEKFAEFSISETALCYKLLAENGSYVCLNLTTNTAHNKDDISPINWHKKACIGLFVIILVVAIWYFPLIVCLFPRTEMNDKGRVMIVLYGTSPQGIRSCIANILGSYIDADCQATKWWETFLIPFLAPLSAVSLYFLERKVIGVRFPPPIFLKDAITSSWFLTCMICLNILIFGLILYLKIVVIAEFIESCTICSDYGDKEDTCHHQENPEYFGSNAMKMHLRIIPNIIKRCLTRTFGFGCSSCISSCPLLRWLLVLLLFPLLLMVFLLQVTAILLYSSPLMTFYIARLCRISEYARAFFEVSYVLAVCVLIIFSLETLVVLASCVSVLFVMGIGAISTIRGGLMDLPDILPTASLGIVFVFYLRKCYIPYPRKYSKLAITLYKYYIAKRVPAVDNQQVQRERLLPKDLYLKACDKLMPLQESKGELVMKVIVYMVITFLIFIFITEAPTSKLNGETKALGTLVASLIPKVLEMLFEKDPEIKKADDEDFAKEVAFFVEEYYKNQNDNTNSNNGASAETEGSQITNEAANNNNDNGLSAGTATSTNENIPLLPRQHNLYGTKNPPENTTQESSA